MNVSDKIIVALDFDNASDAMRMISGLRDKVSAFKIGMELGYDRERDSLISYIKGMGGKVFLDLKLLDVPVTISRTVQKIARTGIDMLSVYGYPAIMQAAADGAAKAAADGFEIEIFGISVLTSYSQSDLQSAGYTVTQRSLVGQRTDHALLSCLGWSAPSRTSS